jgi:small ligand-binding sensory domain FIST
VLFASHHHVEEFSTAASLITQKIGPQVLLGCTGESIIGGGVEVESAPALSLWLARMPGVTVLPMHLRLERALDGGLITGWPEQLPSDWPAGTALLVLGEPFSFPAEMLLEQVNEDHPGVPVFGGMASGATSPGENRLILNGEKIREGAVAAMIYGPIRIRGVTSQGCRPIGTTFVITKAERNVIFELGGVPALTRLREVFATLPARDQQLVNRGLHVGRVMSEYKDHFEQGDFLIKNVIGFDPSGGAIAVGDFMRVGQTVQFHVRDEQSADVELQSLLARRAGASGLPAPAGGLLFTCNGRGTRLFSTLNHDAACVQKAFGQQGEFPLAGFFAQGEIGPVGGKNFVHGFTASLALFESA